jgi:polar amino acid transport system substrate-binding protein
MNGLMQQINNGAPFRLVGQPLTYTPSSLVVDRGDNDLAAALKEIVEAMQKDGTLTRLSMKWFDFDLSHF